MLRRPKSLARDVVMTVLFLGLVWLAAEKLGDGGETVSGAPRVVDGDTLAIGRARIRLIGIDAPERAQVCERGGEDWKCGQEASRHLTDLIGKAVVACEGRADDRYGRRLATCAAARADLNARMVADGFAVAFGDYEAEEADARARRAGLWAGTFDQPREWRAKHGGMVETPHMDLDWIKALLRRIETAWTSR